jgi:hypothetical protein
LYHHHRQRLLFLTRFVVEIGKAFGGRLAIVSPYKPKVLERKCLRNQRILHRTPTKIASLLHVVDVGVILSTQSTAGGPSSKDVSMRLVHSFYLEPFLSTYEAGTRNSKFVIGNELSTTHTTSKYSS